MATTAAPQLARSHHHSLAKRSWWIIQLDDQRVPYKYRKCIWKCIASCIEVHMLDATPTGSVVPPKSVAVSLRLDGKHGHYQPTNVREAVPPPLPCFQVGPGSLNTTTDFLWFTEEGVCEESRSCPSNPVFSFALLIRLGRLLQLKLNWFKSPEESMNG